ncbi:MAG: transposase [Gammaproteobacteria bacterium]|nr:transposase [Gammaproteobacteria bacterium]
MKVHVGADIASGVAHTVCVTPANVADINIMPGLLREDDQAVFGDSAYQKHGYKRAARAAGVFWGVALKGSKQYPLTPGNKRRNRRLSSVRSRVEHLFRIIKCQFGYRKARYRGQAKNAAQVFMLMGLANLYLTRRAVLA